MSGRTFPLCSDFVQLLMRMILNLKSEYYSRTHHLMVKRCFYGVPERSGVFALPAAASGA